MTEDARLKDLFNAVGERYREKHGHLPDPRDQAQMDGFFGMFTKRETHLLVDLLVPAWWEQGE